MRNSKARQRNHALRLARKPDLKDATKFARAGGKRWRKAMSEPIVFGFPRSTFVHIVRLILTHKAIPYTFRDLEREMGKPAHLALHPFNRVPILRHDDFTVYETSAIAMYLEETFDDPPLQPKDRRERARMHQWISAVNSYYYPYMIYHVFSSFPSLVSLPTRRWWRMHYQRSKSVLRWQRNSWGTARIICWDLM
jgi:glutathione S-transferase